MKMTITIGIGLQAIGIIFEGLGLYLAFRALKPDSKEWLSQFRRSRQYFPDQGEIRKERIQLTNQLWLIGGGLALQLIGLFC
jgi:hypothetical protein